MQQESNVMISIFVPTYNHENYIVRALDSILMQQTQYSYEVLVGEDCSTDRTREVLQKWEQEHPGAVTFFYRKENMYHAPVSNSMDLKKRCKGKYIIGLEGDDFWTDPLKLEKQVSFLEAHPQYYAVSHNCVVVGEDSEPNGETYPECKDEEYTLEHFASEIMPGQFTTFLCRNYMTDESFDKELLRYPYGPGDRSLFFSALLHGKVRCMQTCMSAYRHITQGGSSYSATVKYNYDLDRQLIYNRIVYAEKIGNKKAQQLETAQYLICIRYALIHRMINAKRAVKDLRQIKNWLRCVPMVMKRDWNRLRNRKPYF